MKLRQVNHRGFHRPPPDRRSYKSVAFRLFVILPVVVTGLAAAVFAIFASQSTAAPQPAAAAAPNPNCSLSVPANPLTATGLSTPYQLSATDAAGGPCNEANANQSAFVEASIIDPATGAVSVYRPLVIDKGTKAAAAPVVPTLPANAVVGIWFGFNGTTLTLQSTNGSLRQGRCVNGLQGSLFGQFAYCNAPNFFTSANNAIGAGLLKVPALGTAKDGMACPTTRDFGLVDQDQSDNVVTTYLVLGNGQVAQNNAANTQALAGSNPIVNGSDNLLLDAFVDPALGCTPFMAPDLTNNGAMVGSLALDELMAAADQQAPIALVPTNDPMTLNNNAASRTKTNLYRQGVDQTPVANGQSATAYCRNLVTVGQQRTQLDKAMTMNGASPAPAMANNLFTFLANRLNQSFTNLGCMNLLNMNDPVTIQTDGNGVAIGATFAAATGPVGACNPTNPTTPTTPTTPAVPSSTMAAPPADPTATAGGTATATGPAMPSGTAVPSGTATATATATMAPLTSATGAPAAPTTTAPATSCTSMPTMPTAPATTTNNNDWNAAHHARHHPRKY